MSRRTLGWLLVVGGLLVAAVALLVGFHEDTDARAAAVRQAAQRDLVDSMHGWTSRDALGTTQDELRAAQERRETIALVVTGAGVILAAVGGVTVATVRRD